MTTSRRGNPLFEIKTALAFIWRHPANRGKRLRKIAEALAFQFRGRVLHRPTVARIGERSRIIVSPGEGQAGLVYANPVEWPEMACWRRYLGEGDLFVDVGANVGSYTLWAIELGCRVIAVEPDDAARAALQRNLGLNGYTAEVVAAALSDRAGRVPFTQGLGVLNRIDAAGAASSRDVEARTLDDILGDRTAAGVKVDVEGAELLVLRGATRALSEGRIALMQLEWNPSSDLYFSHGRGEVVELLRRYGYETFRPDAEGMLSPIEAGGPGIDVFACRPSDVETNERLRRVVRAGG